jgi:hypothetical protein
VITKAAVCHAQHPNQHLLAWAIGSFLVSQIVVGAVVAPLVAHFWPVLWARHRCLLNRRQDRLRFH